MNNGVRIHSIEFEFDRFTWTKRDKNGPDSNSFVAWVQFLNFPFVRVTRESGGRNADFNNGTTRTVQLENHKSSSSETPT
ncbi:hypothetical protein M8J77_001653 [Diaphorina citri]|nr:hypothetical protein M8J77_001653 [Diaphorina citri]